jgi:hypothetical protein
MNIPENSKNQSQDNLMQTTNNKQQIKIMNVKQLKLKQWWRMLLLLTVCLFAGRDVVQAKIQFKDADMTVVHHPTIKEPWIGVDVRYFMAADNDSYFTKEEY